MIDLWLLYIKWCILQHQSTEWVKLKPPKNQPPTNILKKPKKTPWPPSKTLYNTHSFKQWLVTKHQQKQGLNVFESLADKESSLNLKEYIIYWKYIKSVKQTKS